MKILRYIGNGTIREMSAADIERAYGVKTTDIMIDARVSRDVTVPNALAKKLLLEDSQDWLLRGDADDTEEELTEMAAAEEAARLAQEALDAERHAEDAETNAAKAESGETSSAATTEPVESAPDPKAAPSSRPRPRPQR